MKFQSGDIILLPDNDGIRHFAELQGYDEYHGVWGIIYYTNYTPTAEIGETYEIPEERLVNVLKIDENEGRLFKLLWK